MEKKPKMQSDHQISSYYNDDRALVEWIELSTGLKWRGQLMPTNQSSLTSESRDNHLYKCPECPTFLRNEKKNCSTIDDCDSTKTCCSQYYLVFSSTTSKDFRKDCFQSNCKDESTWWAVDGNLYCRDFIPATHLLPLQVEQNFIVAEILSKHCPACVQLNRQFSGAAHWRSCATCCACKPVETDLVRDSLVRVGQNEKYWQYKPRSRTEADRVLGIFGQSVFRGMGQRSYLPDFHRRSTPVRGGILPANIAPRQVSATYAPRLCDEFACRSVK